MGGVISSTVITTSTKMVPSQFALMLQVPIPMALRCTDSFLDEMLQTVKSVVPQVTITSSRKPAVRLYPAAVNVSSSPTSYVGDDTEFPSPFGESLILTICG